MPDEPQNPAGQPATPTPTPPPGGAVTEQQAMQMFDARDAAREKASSLADKRQQFTESFMGGVPDAYRKQLGDDPEKWLMEARFIQEQFRKDFGPVADRAIGQAAAGDGAGVGYREPASEPAPTRPPPPPFSGELNPLLPPPPRLPGNIDYTKVGGGTSPSKVIALGLSGANLRPGKPRPTTPPNFHIY